MKRVAHELARGTLTRERFIEIARSREPYYVPEGTPLNVQLTELSAQPPAAGVRRQRVRRHRGARHAGRHPRRDRRRVHQRSGDHHRTRTFIPRRPGVYIVNASATIRALNRALRWQLPTDGPKTVNGLLVERLEAIPEPGTTLQGRRVSVRGASDGGQHDQDGAGVRWLGRGWPAAGYRRPRGDPSPGGWEVRASSRSATPLPQSPAGQRRSRDAGCTTKPSSSPATPFLRRR